MVFVTHLHSDHTVGYPDLILTPWVIGRKIPLEVHGPKGIKAMTEHILLAYGEDIKTRTIRMETSVSFRKVRGSTRMRSQPALSTRMPTSP